LVSQEKEARITGWKEQGEPGKKRILDEEKKSSRTEKPKRKGRKEKPERKKDGRRWNPTEAEGGDSQKIPEGSRKEAQKETHDSDAIPFNRKEGEVLKEKLLRRGCPK